MFDPMIIAGVGGATVFGMVALVALRLSSPGGEAARSQTQTTTPEGGAEPRQEASKSRALVRHRMDPNHIVDLYCCDNVRIRGRALDITDSGLGILCAGPLERDTFVYLEIRDVMLCASGYVRHCRQQKNGNYVIGVEFKGPLMRTLL